MKILLNGYPNSLPGARAKVYGGPQGFVNTFTQFVDAHTTHTYTGFIFVHSARHKKHCRTKRHRQGRHTWLECSLDLRYRSVVAATKSARLVTCKDRINAVSEVLCQEKPDVVFINGFSFATWYLLKACVATGIPFVAVHHGLWYREVRAATQYFTAAGRRLTEEMERDITRYAAAEIFLNDWAKQIYNKELIRTNPRRTFVIPLPFRQEFLNQPSLKPQRNKTIVIGTVARWDTIKNPEAFLRLAETAKKQNLPWLFYSIVHFTKNKSLEKLQARYEQAVTTLPQTDARGLKAFYRRSSLLVLPSRFDVSPTVVLEALLQNKITLISPNVGWVSLYKKFGLTDWIDSFDQPQKTLKKIARLLNTTPPTALINHIATHYAPYGIFKQYITLLEKINNQQ